jgi:hypothetical protein
MREDRRTFFEQLREIPVVSSTEIVAEWVAIALRSEPWRSMPLDDLLGELPRITSVLLEEVSRRDLQRTSILELEARSHGSFRRRQLVGQPALTEEASILGDAMRAVLRRGGASEVVTEGVAAMMSRDLSLIRRAMCAGYSDGPCCDRR